VKEAQTRFPFAVDRPLAWSKQTDPEFRSLSTHMMQVPRLRETFGVLRLSLGELVGKTQKLLQERLLLNFRTLAEALLEVESRDQWVVALAGEPAPVAAGQEPGLQSLSVKWPGSL
jgi:hypothetical protein